MRNTPSGTGTMGGWSPVLCRTGEVGVCSRKWKTEGRGVAEIPEGTPPHAGKRRGVGGRGDLFLEFSATEPLFFRNLQLMTRSFF